MAYLRDADAVWVSLARAVTPDPILTVSEWAERARVLSSKASAREQPWRNATTPYLVEIMDRLSVRSDAREVVFKKAAQVGGTEAANNWLGYLIEHAPTPILAIAPTLEMAKRNARQRIDPMIEASPSLRAVVAPKKSRDRGNTDLSKDFPGGVLILAGANSAASLRSMPAGALLLDECDAYPLNLDKEGDPAELAIARTRTFPRSKILWVSTPKVRGLSRICDAFDRSDQRRYFVPCPRCGEMQPLEWDRLRYDDEDDPRRVRVVHYACAACDALIDEREKRDMLRAGEWRPTSTEGEPGVYGYHLSALYSPFPGFGWVHAVRLYLRARVHQDLWPNFANTVLGEAHQDDTDAPDWRGLYLRRAKYKPGAVPPGVLFLTAGVDVQKDRLELELVGWGRARVSWSVDYVTFHGDPALPDVWRELETYLATPVPLAWAPGEAMPIRCMAVDTGYLTRSVLDWVKRHPQPIPGTAGPKVLGPRTVVAIRGSKRELATLVATTKISLAKRRARGAVLWLVDGGQVKTEFYAALRLPQPEPGALDPPGWVHFPEYPETWFQQVTSERRVTRYRKGYPFTTWEKDPGARNEALDCRVYARAAANLCGLDRFGPAQWRALEAALPVPPPPEPPPEGAPPPPDEPTPPPLPPGPAPATPAPAQKQDGSPRRKIARPRGGVRFSYRT